MSLDELTDAVDDLCQADPATLADNEAVKVLHRQLARLDAVTTRAAAAYDASGDWEESRARSCAAWIAAICNLPLPEARRRISNGRALRHMPLVEEAWLAPPRGAVAPRRSVGSTPFGCVWHVRTRHSLPSTGSGPSIPSASELARDRTVRHLRDVSLRAAAGIIERVICGGQVRPWLAPNGGSVGG